MLKNLLTIKNEGDIILINIVCFLQIRNYCEKSSKMYNFSSENVQVILRQKVYKSLGDGFPV